MMDIDFDVRWGWKTTRLVKFCSDNKLPLIVHSPQCVDIIVDITKHLWLWGVDFPVYSLRTLLDSMMWHMTVKCGIVVDNLDLVLEQCTREDFTKLKRLGITKASMTIGK